MVGNRALMARSALSTKVKISSLAQMVIRRCANNIGGGPKTLKQKHLTKLMMRMKKSGYEEHQRLEVLLAGLRGFKKMESDERNGVRPINRPSWVGARSRRLKKLTGKRTWFRKTKQKEEKRTGGRSCRSKKKIGDLDEVRERDIESVMFVPYTKGSRLQKILQESDDQYIRGNRSKRIRFVERGGQTLEQILGRSDPWGNRGCERMDCLQCQHGGGEGGECQKENLLYEITCLKCKQEKVVTVYVGESSRTGHRRGGDTSVTC